MYKDDFYALVKNMQEEEQDILFRKGHDYQCGSDDVLANFKRIAERLSLSPLEVWAVYFLKHIDAILTFVKKGEVASEDIEGRFNDARNYLLLGYAIILDMETDGSIKRTREVLNRSNLLDWLCKKHLSIIKEMDKCRGEEYAIKYNQLQGKREMLDRIIHAIEHDDLEE